MRTLKMTILYKLKGQKHTRTLKLFNPFQAVGTNLTTQRITEIVIIWSSNAAHKKIK